MDEWLGERDVEAEAAAEQAAVPLNVARADRQKAREKRRAEAAVQSERQRGQQQKSVEGSGVGAETLDGSQSVTPAIGA